MSIPELTLSQLDVCGVEYQEIVLSSPLDIWETAQYLQEDVSKLVRIVALKGDGNVCIAVLPYSFLLDIKAINHLKGSEYSVLPEDSVGALFSGCEISSFAPISGVCNVEMIIDSNVLEMNEIIVQSGSLQHLIKINQESVNLLYRKLEIAKIAASKGCIYAGHDQGGSDNDVDMSFTSIRLKQRIDETFDLPAMPQIAQDIMKLRVDPSADAIRLAQIVSRDPSLAAQVISWASSPYYGYQGKVDSVETAIARVLGFDLVMNLALGISIGKSLNVPMDGPLGVKEFWKQAIYSASLSEKLCRTMPIKQRPERGLIYLSGLLHNFGHLLLGHIFPPQFNLVNTAVLANPHIAIEDIEFYVLGITHEEIGGWLMKNWHMPDELIVAVQRHHQEEFWSKHAVYSNIVLIANRLLKRLGIGDAVDTNLPQSTLELLAIDEGNAESALRDIELEAETLDIMAKQLVA